MAIITAARPSLLRVCGAGEFDLAIEDNSDVIAVWKAHAVFAFNFFLLALAFYCVWMT